MCTPTANRVWSLLSTSAGLSSWFVAAVVAPGLGGSVGLTYGPGAVGDHADPRLGGAPAGALRRRGRAPAPGAHELAMTPIAGGFRVDLIDDGVADAEVVPTRVGWTQMLQRLRTRGEAAPTT